MGQPVSIRGARELISAFKQLGAVVENRVMRTANVAGAKVYRDVARSAALRAGMHLTAALRLRDAIRHKRSRGQPGMVVAGIFIASDQAKNRKSNDPRAWWLWFDQGTAMRTRGGRTRSRSLGRKASDGAEVNPATGRRRGKRVFSFKAYLGEKFRKKNGNTGRITATHWLSNVFDSASAKALAAVEDRAEKRLAFEVKKLAKLGGKA